MSNLRFEVWFHNPRANPNWIDDNEYYTWRSEIDLDPEPTQGQLDAAAAAVDYATENGAILLESDKYSIIGNGIDAATVTVTFRLPYPDHVILTIGGQDVTVPFLPKEIGAPFERVASITNLVSTIPGEAIVIEPVEWFAADFSGGNPLIIEVT